MIVDILTVLFFVLGFALLFWMKGERRHDVLHYVTEPSRGGVPDNAGRLAGANVVGEAVAHCPLHRRQIGNEYGGTARAGRTKRTGGKTIGDRSRASTGA